MDDHYLTKDLKVISEHLREELHKIEAEIKANELILESDDLINKKNRELKLKLDLVRTEYFQMSQDYWKISEKKFAPILVNVYKKDHPNPPQEKETKEQEPKQ